MSLFSPAEAAAPVSPASNIRFRSKYQSSSSSADSSSFTKDSNLSSLGTPPYQVDGSSIVVSTPGIVASQYTIKSVEKMVFDSYTQVSDENQDSGKGRFGLPYALTKVGF